MRAKHITYWLMGTVLAIAAALMLAPDVGHAQGSDTAEIPLEPGWNLVSCRWSLTTAACQRSGPAAGGFHCQPTVWQRAADGDLH